MKRIIALWHLAGKGKTGTLIELGNLLLDKYKNEDNVEFVYDDKELVNKNYK